MDKESLLTLIDLHLDGKLIGKELENFQSLLKSDPSLQEEVDEQRRIRQAVRLQARKDKLRTISKLNDELKNDTRKSRIRTLMVTVSYCCFDIAHSHVILWLV